MLNNIRSILYFKHFKLLGYRNSHLRCFSSTEVLLLFHETPLHKHTDETLNSLSACMLWYIIEY